MKPTLDENNLNKDILEKLKLTIEFYKEKDEKMALEHSVNICFVYYLN